MKIAMVYTSTTPELVDLVEKEVIKNIGFDVEFLNYQDGAILAEIRQAGYVTPVAGAKLIEFYMSAVKEGADAILNICSSVGEVADAASDIGKYLGVPIVRIDEDMCKDAVRHGKRIGVLATLPTTLDPTKNTIKRVARELGKEVVLIDCLIDGGFGLNQNEFKALLLEKAGEIQDKVDVILLCQGSMAYCEELIANTYDKLVVSSPRYGAVALKNALIEKGLLPLSSR